MCLPYDDIQQAPPRNQIESPGGFLRLQVHESRRRELSAPLAGIQRRKLDLKSPPGTIPNFGAGHEIKSQPRFVHAVLTCRFASQPPCRSRVPGRRLRKETSPPNTELLAFVEPEGAKQPCQRWRNKNFVREKYRPDIWHSSRSNHEGVVG